MTDTVLAGMGSFGENVATKTQPHTVGRMNIASPSTFAELLAYSGSEDDDDEQNVALATKTNDNGSRSVAAKADGRLNLFQSTDSMDDNDVDDSMPTKGELLEFLDINDSPESPEGDDIGHLPPVVDVHSEEEEYQGASLDEYAAMVRRQSARFVNNPVASIFDPVDENFGGMDDRQKMRPIDDGFDYSRAQLG